MVYICECVRDEFYDGSFSCDIVSNSSLLLSFVVGVPFDTLF